MNGNQLPELLEGDVVRIKNTGYPELDGETGVIRGIVSENVMFVGRTYIIKLPSTFSSPSYKYSHIVLAESCLEEIFT